MKNSNEIQDIFQKLENEVSDDLSQKESVWEKVEKRLDKKEEKKNVIPFPIWKITGIAASLLLLVGVGYFIWDYYNSPAVMPFNIPSQERISSSNNEELNLDENLNSVEPIDSSQFNSTQIVQEKSLLNSNEKKAVPTQKNEAQYFRLEEPEQQIVSNMSPAESEGTLIENQVKKINDEIKPDVLPEINIAKVDPEIKPTSIPEKNFPQIQGLLVDDYGPIADAEVAVRGGSETVITDENGKFQIAAQIGDVLTITDAMGTSQDYAVNKKNLGQLNFGGAIELEVVTVSNPRGRVRKSKHEKNNKVGYISPNNINKSEKMSIDQMLAGKVSGLNSVAQNGGAPDSTPIISIRGTSSLSNLKEPLYVIDGILIDSNSLKLIDAKKIESVNILKGNSATALYGSRGANGVVILKTKKGLSKRILKKLEKEAEKNNQSGLERMEVEISNEEYSSFVENKFENPAMNPLSTFSVDVDKAAYSNIRRMLNNGQTVPKDAVRIEEMINYFHYNYPQPKDKHPFSINTEYSDSPWNPGHKLLKIGLQGKNIPTENLPNSNLVFLIDVSGSMNDENKLPLLKKSLELLVNNLREKDKVSIVVYAGAAGVVLQPTSGANKSTILEALERLSAGGSTAGAAGIELAYQLAQESFIKDGNNRVILATDGDFNVGTSAVKDLETLIEEKRKTGIFLTCLGYGMGNYKDNRMETLANKGNGNYAYIDNLQEANKFLVREFSGTLFSIAKDVKIQIEFNPQFVQSYRLIGYETRLLNDEDFVNDAIDAGEIGAGHQVTALYEIIPAGTESNFIGQMHDLKYSNYSANNSFNNELATIKFRYKKPDGDKSTEIVQPVYNKSVPLKDATEDFKFVADVAWFGLKLRDSEYIEIKDKNKIIELGKQAVKDDKEGYKSEFLRLVELVK